MKAENNILLNRVFTRNTVKALIEKNTNETYFTAIKRYINDPDGKNHQELISEIYRRLDGEYRNEYFYKNTLMNKLLLGVHSPMTTTALTEVPVSKSKADFILINGKAVVYEIKTELDNFDRLESQIEDYYKAFSYVCVVTCDSNYEALEKMLKDSPVGIYVLTAKNRLSRRKEPICDISHLNFEVIFKILRKKEYETILQTHYGYLPNVTQFNYYSASKKMFMNISTDTAYKLFTKELKKRNRIDIKSFSKVPYELKSLIYFSDFGNSDYNKLQNFLLSRFGG